MWIFFYASTLLGVLNVQYRYSSIHYFYWVWEVGIPCHSDVSLPFWDMASAGFLYRCAAELCSYELLQSCPDKKEEHADYRRIRLF